VRAEFASFQRGGRDVKKKERIVRYTAEQVDEMIRQGKDQTDWAKVDAMTDADIERLVKDDPDEDVEWGDWQVGLPLPKQHLNLRLDAEVVEWFKKQGRGYQTRMNAVLRAYVRAQQGAKKARGPNRKSAKREAAE
jgi:uncharacterized protein (DUF4415 family)